MPLSFEPTQKLPTTIRNQHIMYQSCNGNYPLPNTMNPNFTFQKETPRTLYPLPLHRPSIPRPPPSQTFPRLQSQVPRVTMTSISSGPTTYTFNSKMDDIDDPSHYPPYLQGKGKHGKEKAHNDPLRRGRKIFDNGTESSAQESCTNCLNRGLKCMRYRAKYGKCAFCTANDLHPEGLCHLVGVPEPTELSRTALMKKRKLNSYHSDIDAQSNMSNDSAFGKFTAPTSAPRSVRGQAPSPDPIIHVRGPQLPPLNLPAHSDATLERVTALEDQVARLEAGFKELLVRLDELSSTLKSPVSVVHLQRQAEAGESAAAVADRKDDRMSVSEERVGPSHADLVQEWAHGAQRPYGVEGGEVLLRDEGSHGGDDAKMADANGIGYD